ncbi:cytochrome P450 [Sphingobium sp. Sx8-8]|uniref:cytochrome P450 n=1 Tax=Sphingobium sp. Sx8-8 TaxID=2933617 RepID=UPI001F55C8C3|nr:cytochrome P450 [Sphingobium sp. Sx8-8]
MSPEINADNIDTFSSRMADPTFCHTPEYGHMLRWLRENDPVRWAQPWPDRGAWLIARHADLKMIYDQPNLFSSEAAGNIIPADPDFHKHDRESQGFGVMVSNTDPPRHGDLRRVFARYFSGPQVAKLDGQCQKVVEGILDEMQGRDTFDYAMETATQVPARMIFQLLGIPREDWARLEGVVSSFAFYSDPEFQLGDSPGATFRKAMDITFDYIAKLVEQRRHDPQEDLCTIAAQGQIDGEPWTEQEAAWGAWQLLAAGFETSRNVIAGGLLALLQHPDQMALLRADPGLMNTAIGEMLRWTSPATTNLRVATADTEIAGRKIAKGDWLFLMIDSANRDESVFADPYRFDITRKINPYLTFGHGTHNCIGRMLAMLEAKVMLRNLLARTDHIEIAGPLVFGGSVAKGVKHLPVRIAWSQDHRHRIGNAA